MKQHHFKIRLTVLLKILLAFAVLISAIFWAKSLAKGVVNGIGLCLNSLIPSLFFFLCLSAFLMRSDVGEKMFFFCNKPLSRFFRIPPSLVSVFCFSLLGGFPVGAKLLSDSVEEKKLSQIQAERMLAYCVNCGPAFLISAVSVPIFNNYSIGLIVYLSQVLAAIAVGWLCGRRMPASDNISTGTTPARKSFSENLVLSVRSSVSSMAMICAFVLLFTGLNQVLKDSGLLTRLTAVLEHIMTEEKAGILLTGLLEVTSGCSGLSACKSLLLFALLTGFGGLCVQIQIQALINRCGMRMKYFYLYRPVYLAVSLFSSMVLVRFFGGAATVFSAQSPLIPRAYTVSPFGSILLIGLSVMLLLSCKKPVIIGKNKGGRQR